MWSSPKSGIRKFSSTTVSGSSPTSGAVSSSAPATSVGAANSTTAATSSPLAPQTEHVKGIITVKVVIDKKNNRVVFVESHKDFIDVLFSFLTLPIGKILKLVGEKSPCPILCLGNLYESVRNLGTGLFVTEICKEVLLNPRSAFEYGFQKLMIQYDLDTHKCFYVCKNEDCRDGCEFKLSEFPNVKCQCGGMMDQLVKHSKTLPNDDGGVFVKGTAAEKFIISDDLQVIPGLSSLSILLLRQLDIMDINELETRTVNVGDNEVLKLLHLSMVSTTPLTHWILEKQEFHYSLMLEPRNISVALNTTSTEDAPKKRLTLFTSKSKHKVLYADCEEDFIDFLLSFLTFPLGSIHNLLGGKSMIGCLDNLYASVSDQSTGRYFKSEDSKAMLLNPKLAPCFTNNNSLLQVAEDSDHQYKVLFENKKPLYGKVIHFRHFMKGPAKYMIMDDLKVGVLSPTESISLIGKFGVPLADVDVIQVEVGPNTARDLLRASLISESVLTDVFKEQIRSFPYPTI